MVRRSVFKFLSSCFFNFFIFCERFVIERHKLLHNDMRNVPYVWVFMMGKEAELIKESRWGQFVRPCNWSHVPPQDIRSNETTWCCLWTRILLSQKENIHIYIYKCIWKTLNCLIPITKTWLNLVLEFSILSGTCVEQIYVYVNVLLCTSARGICTPHKI